MAIDKTNHALGVEQISLLTQTYAPEILETATGVNSEVFEKLKIKVHRDLQHVNKVMIFNRHMGTARRYKPGNLPKSTIGYLSERKLEVVLSVDRFYENIQNFREKEPFQVPTLENAYDAPVTRYLLLQGAKGYRANVLNCLFCGDIEKAGSYELYNGFYQHIKEGIAANEISEKNRNYVRFEAPLTDLSTDEECYEAYLEFHKKMDEKLKAQPEIMILVPENLHAKITQGYIKSNPAGSVTLAETYAEGYRFVTTPKSTLVSDPVLGDGFQMIATVPWNLEFGTDADNPDATSITVERAQEDFNILIFQVQSAQGVRIRQISSDKFCVTEGNNVPVISMGGEYREDTLTVGVNIAEAGTATAAPAKDSYTQGEEVTLTASATENYNFLCWADGNTSASRKITFSGFPESYMAVFTKKA